ncbi:GNAT family N-acetyltransferase [Metabacillus iocasae]|uniref:N-acetylglutamate synthase-like GNAT family acetyltransferase n=1 Tax=Priestia iocasae TaxID=2291674 RepID=A0ABS2QX73_9BACI|nr:acetyltransferase [Metabacillus iocasae]MBM7704068.1 N-acetylglutamate synthase-like GNAT family acetyltransferase [Metabacillus iocasae]
MNERIQLATMNDVSRVNHFLQKADVSVEDLECHIEHFVIMENDKKELLATVGFQKEGASGLLRSLVIVPSLTQEKILMLFKSVVSLAKENGIDQLFLVTNKEASLSFFELLHFQIVSKESIPIGLQEQSNLLNTHNVDKLYVMCYQE